MTYRDLIIYVLENHLEDEEIFKDGKIAGFMTVEEAATKYEVGLNTISVWINMNMLPYTRLGDFMFIPENATNPRDGFVDYNDEKDLRSIITNRTHDFYNISGKGGNPSYSYSGGLTPSNRNR